jgi:GntR family transcriptional regulator/MocR family aminotransferase
MLTMCYIAHTNLLKKNIPILHFIIKNIINDSKFDLNNTNYPLYQNLYFILRDAIKKNTIPDSFKLPPSRVLAKDLGISRSTVIKSYDLLVLEKYVSSKQGAGYYVYAPEKSFTEIENMNVQNFQYPKISRKAKLFTKYKYISTDNFSKNNIAFRPGLPPLDLFPVKKWKNLSNNYWREATPTKLSYAPSEGLDSLRISISNYLKLYRNIDCDYNQIIIVSGSLHSLYLIGNTILNKNDTVIMENPTFPRAYNLFKSLKANIVPCNVDAQGLNINLLEKNTAKLIYSTPSNQYPLGIKMNYERRIELLQWASKKNALIIEDDYDHEFSNWENPTPSIYSLDTENRVIYQGTFNKLLHPSLRLGYMIVPTYLIEPIKAIYEQSSRFIPSSTQEIMSQFIDKDHLNKHLRSVIKVARERRALFVNYTKDVFDIASLNQGLHLIGKIKSNINDTNAFNTLLKHNVVAYPLSNYYITKEKKQGLVIGYSSVNNKVMKDKTNIIKTVLE